jgi:hypothetical protein
MTDGKTQKVGRMKRIDPDKCEHLKVMKCDKQKRELVFIKKNLDLKYQWAKMKCMKKKDTNQARTRTYIKY